MCATAITAFRPAKDGLHIYNRDGHHVAGRSIRAFATSLSGVEADGAHAFYLVMSWRKRDRALARRALCAGQSDRLERGRAGRRART